MFAMNRAFGAVCGAILWWDIVASTDLVSNANEIVVTLYLL